MLRFFFYFLFAGAIGGTSAFVLFVPQFMPAFFNTNNLGSNGYQVIEGMIRNIVSGNFTFGTTAPEIFMYGLALFLLINASILLTMLMIFLFSGFRLGRIYKFYRISAWFYVSTIIMTATYCWYVWDTISKQGLTFGFEAIRDLFPWTAVIPISVGFGMVLVSILFRLIDGNSRSRNF